LAVVAVGEAFGVAVIAAAAAEVVLLDGVADFAVYCCCQWRKLLTLWESHRSLLVLGTTNLTTDGVCVGVLTHKV